MKRRVVEDFELAAESQAGLVVKGRIRQKTDCRRRKQGTESSLMEQFVTGTEARPLETIAKMQPSMVAGLWNGSIRRPWPWSSQPRQLEHAGAIIAKLPEEKRADVIYRIATLDSVSPAVIDRIEEALSKEIGIVVIKARAKRSRRPEKGL